MAPPRTTYAPTLYAALLLATTAAFVAWRHHSPPRGPVARRAALPAATVAHATRDDLTLDERPIPIPDRVLNERGCLTEPRRWVFPGATRATAAARLERILRGDGRALALASLRCEAAGCAVDAPSVVVESLDPAERPAFYADLAASELNPPYVFPFRRHRSRTPFHQSPGLPMAAAEVVARTSWTRQGVSYFADLAAACERVHTDADRRALVRAIHLPVTVVVGLRTNPSAVERLVASVPLRLRPFVRSALTEARGRAQATAPIDALFPPEARRRVGTWPSPGEEELNCFWTALHFQDGDVRERLPDPPAAMAALQARFERLDDVPARFGDVMAFYRADGALEHLAVHLFAGVFFTKNGVSIVQPWRIARLEDVLLDYPTVQRVELWRRRGDP